ncbi:MAG: GH25 family lysozyme [Dysgonamonadaceae bacterium]
MTVKRRRSPRKRSKRKKKLSINQRRLITAIASTLFLGILIWGVFRIKNVHNSLLNTFNHPAFTLKYPVRGVDVSHHNGGINWDELRQENVSFAYLKSTEGVSIKDKDYKENYKLAKEAGLSVGTYLFYTFKLDGGKQAKLFIRNSNVESQDLVPAIDVEHSRYNRMYKNSKERDQIVQELKVLEKELFKHYKVRPVIYTNKDCYKLYIKDHFPDNPLWICDLEEEPSDEINNWVIWQFSHSGDISGSFNDIDLNYYRYSFKGFSKLLMP